MAAGESAGTVELHDVPGPRAFGQDWRRLWTLIWLSSVSEFKLMYVGSALGSALGYVWAVARPLLTFVVLYLVFSRFFKVGEAAPFYAQMLLLNLSLFSLLSDTSGRAMKSYVAREGILRKMNFPHAVIPLSVVLTGVFTFAFTLIVVFAIVIGVGTPVRATWLLLPLLWLLMLVFSAAMAVTLATLFVRFRDIEQIWGVGLLTLFYLTPIMYPVELVPSQFHWMLVVNPIAPILMQNRVWGVDPAGETALDIAPHGLGLIVPGIIFIGVCACAVILVARRTRTVAEDL
jgi:ABC-2 type transport system permease protein